MSYQNDLYHHGVKGMHWGRLNGPPYPIGSGPKQSMTEREDAAKKRKRKWAIFSRNKSEKKKNDEEESKEFDDEEKKRIIRSGTASEISKYADKFTTSELQEAMNRYRIRRDVRNAVIKEEEEKKNKGFDEIDKAMRKVKSVSDWANTAKNIYSTGKYFLNEIDRDNKKKDSEKKDDEK